jgi:hypothetical protein
MPVVLAAVYHRCSKYAVVYGDYKTSAERCMLSAERCVFTLSTQYSVLGSRFSVPGSRFSVLGSRLALSLRRSNHPDFL